MPRPERNNPPVDQALPKSSRLSTVVGTLFLFVTFTQVSGGGAFQYLLTYLPIALVSLLLLNALAGEHETKPANSGWLLIVFAAVILASLSVNGLQYMVVFLGYASVFAIIDRRALLQELPKYAYYAAILNVVIYLSEVVLRGQLGLPFDPTMFNYVGAGREEVISTWQFSRYAGHQTEPGSFAANLGALAVLSLAGDRKPTWFHWIAVLTLASTLSITAVLMATILTVSIFLANRVTLKTVIVYVMTVALAAVAIIQLLPLLGLPTIDFLVYRLQSRDTIDGSLYVKSLLIDDVLTRSSWETLIGNRHGGCDYCQYAKSLGFGFYMVFHGGLVGVFALATFAAVSWGRLGRRGLALVMVLILARVQFFFPQAMMFYVAISGLSLQHIPKARSVILGAAQRQVSTQ